MDNFYEKLQKQLKKMTEQEKDAWILSQAKILPEWEQEDFYKSVCGTKKIIYGAKTEMLCKGFSDCIAFLFVLQRIMYFFSEFPHRQKDGNVVNYL